MARYPTRGGVWSDRGRGLGPVAAIAAAAAVAVAGMAAAAETPDAQAADSAQRHSGGGRADALLAQAGSGRSVSLKIPAQSLDSALTALADQAGLQILFTSDEVAGRSTAGPISVATRSGACDQRPVLSTRSASSNAATWSRYSDHDRPVTGSRTAIETTPKS